MSALHRPQLVSRVSRVRDLRLADETDTVSEMALDERADAVTTVDAAEADTPFPGLSVAPEPTNGQDHEPTTDEHEDAAESEAEVVPMPGSLVRAHAA